MAESREIPSTQEGRVVRQEAISFRIPRLGETQVYHLVSRPEGRKPESLIIAKAGVASATRTQLAFLNPLLQTFPNSEIHLFSDIESFESRKPPRTHKLISPRGESRERGGLKAQGLIFRRAIREVGIRDTEYATFIGVSAGAGVGLSRTFENVILLDPVGFVPNELARMSSEAYRVYKELEKKPVFKERFSLSPHNRFWLNDWLTFGAGLRALTQEVYTKERVLRRIGELKPRNFVVLAGKEDRVIKGEETFQKLKDIFSDSELEPLSIEGGEFYQGQVGETRVVIGAVEGNHYWALAQPELFKDIIESIGDLV